MEYKYKLSIIIPCHNSINTIGRLLDTIVNNTLKKEDYEIVIVDDDSTDNFMTMVSFFKDKANIAYYKTDTKVHCPGNTRQVGLDNAKGEWITFIDHDDYFEHNVFGDVFEIIEMNHIDTVLCTKFKKMCLNGRETEYDGEEVFHLLHGKFYNHDMLLDGGIRFKEDLISHEDVYFNTKVIVYLLTHNKLVHNVKNLHTYNWVETESSISHYRNGTMIYIDLHLDDLIYASIVPLLELPDTFYDYKFHNILMNLFVVYFLYEEGLTAVGDDYPSKHNRDAIVNIKKIILSSLDINNDDIIKYFNDNPAILNNSKLLSFNDNIDFMDLESFKNFIYDLDK